MKYLFCIVVLFLLNTSFLFGQMESLYSRSFETNVTTTALLTFKSGGGTIEIEESSDNKFYIEHSIEFKNYSKRQKEKVIKEIRNRYEVDAKMLGNNITTTYNNKSNGMSVFRIDSYMNSKYILNKTSDSLIKHKSNKAFVDEITEVKTSGYYLINSIMNSEYLSESRKQQFIKRYSNTEKKAKEKTYHVKVKIKIPKHLNVTVNSKFTKIILRGYLKNKFSIRCSGGRLFADGFENKDNLIKVKDGIIIMKSMSGGKLALINSRQALLGTLDNLKLDAEFSKIEIGQINTSVEINDFTSKYLIHNFSNDFEALTMNAEYSEINIFFPKNTSYYLETFGRDTVHYRNGITTEISPNGKNQSSKMMVIGKDTSPNKILINTTHGIIRFGEDFIDTSN